MNNNFRVAFYLDGRKNKQGKTPILYRICMRGKRVSMGGTGHSIISGMWCRARARVAGNTSEARYINSELDNIESDLRTIFRRLEFSEKLSLERIKSIYLRTEEKQMEKSFLSFFDYVMQQKEEEVGHGLAIGTVRRYRTTRKRLGEYVRDKLKRKDIYFSDLNYKLLTDFERYLRVQTGVAENTAKGRLKCIKAVIKVAMKEGILSKDPGEDVPTSFSPVNRGFLPEDDVRKLMNYNFTSERLEKVRDFFVFSCFTGLAYTDLAALTYNNIVEQNGRTWIVKSRQKTGVASNVPLLQIPLDIIEKYRGKAEDNHVFPVMTNQRINSYLKEIAEACGIKKNLTFHLARHTFGTLMVSMGVPFDSVSRMMGHTNLKTTLIYARITNNKIGEDMDKIAEKLKDLNGTLSNMHAKKKKNDDADTCDIPAARHERKRKEQMPDEEVPAPSSTIPACNPVQHDTNAPINVKSIQYVDGKMVITTENGVTFELNSSSLQSSLQEPIIDKPVPKPGRQKDQSVDTSSPVAEQQSASSKVSPVAVPDEVPAPAKKRGRPRKVIEQVVPAVEDAVAAPAKKRGRPKKQVAEQASPENEDKATSAVWGVGQKFAIQDSPRSKRRRPASLARMARVQKPKRRK